MIADSTRNKTAQKPLGLHYNEISISAPCNDSALASTRHRKSQILRSSWESRANGALECRFDGRDRLSVELDEMLRLRIDPVPTPQVRQQARRDRDRRLVLIGLRATLFPAIITSAFQIDVGATDRWDRGCGSIAAAHEPL